MGNCCWNRLIRRTFVKRRLWLLSAFPSVAVHVMRSQVIVVNADRLPGTTDEGQKDHGVAVDRPTRLAQANDHAIYDSNLDGPLVRHGRAASHSPRTYPKVIVCASR